MTPQEFDPTIYYRIAARNLYRLYGQDALMLCDRALSKMQALGDPEGFDIWLGIHKALVETTVAEERPQGATLH